MTNIQEDWQPHITVNECNIWYTGDITLKGIHSLIDTFNNLISSLTGNKKITLFMQSNGGCVSSALLLYDYLNLNYKLINFVGLTKICSCATLFLFTKCNTYVFPNIYVLFHPMSLEFNDNSEGVDKRNRFYKNLSTRVNNIYSTKNFKVNWQTKNTYLYAQDLIDKNIVIDIYSF